MYCIHCGADNLDTAKFCRKCGLAVEGEEETRVAPARRSEPAGLEPIASDLTDNEPAEAEIFSIGPTLLFVKGGYVLAALAALLIVAMFAAFTSISTWLAIVIGLLLFLVPAYHHFRQRLITYRLTETKLQTDEGLIARTSRSVPIRRIQDVTVSSGVAQRLLGFGDVVIDNASEEGGKIVLRNINDPRKYADLLLKQIRRLER